MRHRYLGLAVLLTGLIAGCSAGAPGVTPVASLSGHGTSTAPGQPLTEAQGDQDMLAFTRCMRDHGVQMSDPVHRPGHAGLSLELPERNAASAAGYAACTHYIQPIMQAKEAGAASEAAPHMAALTRYARCMRSHDIGMLDPTPEGQLNLGQVPGITSSFGRYSPQFRSADAACRHFLPADVHDDGTGP
ncbi:MAG TPA: hypothetical protein VFV73_08630 [Streptosporangiaceae bacterium]|nr:hypothetical protein [Streptosporangiaceae bacterium]